MPYRECGAFNLENVTKNGNFIAFHLTLGRPIVEFKNLALVYCHILFCYFDNCTFITTLSSVTVIVQSTCTYVRVYGLCAHFTHYVHNTVPTSQMRGGQWAPSVCLLSEISRCVWTDLDESFSSRTTPWPSGECGKVHTHKRRAGGVDRFFQLCMYLTWPV